MLSPALKRKHELTNDSNYYNIVARGPLLDRVYSMRYRSYSAENFIDDDGTSKFMDEYDSMPNCVSYLLYQNKKPVASIRACVYDPADKLMVPAMEIFDQEIRDSIGYGDHFTEINKFVVDPSFQKRGGVRARFELFKPLAQDERYDDTKNFLMAVRESHVKFYQKIFDCEQISDNKEYPHLKFKTVLLLLKNVRQAREIVVSKAAQAI